MSEYTPTTAQMRKYLTDRMVPVDVQEQFDRWLAETLAKEFQRGRDFEQEINTPLFPCDEAAIRADEREKAAEAAWETVDAMLFGTGGVSRRSLRAAILKKCNLTGARTSGQCANCEGSGRGFLAGEPECPWCRGCGHVHEWDDARGDGSHE